LEYLLRTALAPPVEEVLTAAGSDLHVPALCDVEVAAGLRRAMLRGEIDEDRTLQAVEDYLDLPLSRHGHQRLIGRILDLRDNFSVYDATYVALAERSGGALLTGDERLARATRTHTGLATLPQ